MEVNGLLSLTLNAVICTIIGFFIIGKILEKIKNKNKTFAAIYSFILDFRHKSKNVQFI